MKNSFVFCLLLLITFSRCNFSHEQKTETNISEPIVSEKNTFKVGDKTFYIQHIPDADSVELGTQTKDSSENYFLQIDSPFVKRRSDTLIFALLNKKNASLIDHKNTDDNYAEYTYLGKLRGINNYYVRGVFWEWYNYFLINPTNGDTTTLWGTSKVSPNKKYLIATNLDLHAAFTYNGFQLFEIEGNNLRFIGSKELDTWGTDNFCWKNDTELIVKRYIIDTTHTSKDGYKKDYVKILIQSGK